MDAAPPEIAEWMVYLLAASMGLVFGPILGAPQWWVLRRWVDKAIWWIPANAVAWAGGMVAIFVGMNSGALQRSNLGHRRLGPPRACYCRGDCRSDSRRGTGTVD